MTLVDLLRPLHIDAFFREVWNRTSWQGHHSVSPLAAREILDLAALEQTLAALHRPGDSWLQLARDGRRALPAHMIGDDGLLNLRELYAAFANGETLYLTKAERLVPSLARMCRAIELELRARGIGCRQPVNAHVFLTPPRSQGFPPHRDEHAGLVVQLEGHKAWRVYDRTTEPAATRDLPTQPGTVDAAALGAEVRTYTLAAGDTLYIPEGWVHEAEAQDAHSLHVTFRLFALRWSDVLLALAARHPALAGPVPPHSADDPAPLVRALGVLLDSEAFRAPLAGVVEQIVREQVVPARVLPQDGLRQVVLAGAHALDTALVHRAGAACHVFVDGDRACIAFPGGAIRGPAVMAGVFRYVAATPRFCARDLPPLADLGASYDRLDVARMLVRDGLLRIDVDALDAASTGAGSARSEVA
ncbi:MAG TPA: cupin domain-containing protein [Kofleriaceae bacterium]|nr:cupin domain-containing protein [Kofleriaceae bacterium]